MKIWVLSFFCVLASFRVGVNSFSCAPPEFRHTTPCEIPKCCESGELTTEFCSGCPTCAAAKEEECGAGFEAYQPDCAKGLACFTRCDPCTTVKPNDFDDDADGSPKKEVHNCVFPFKYKGKTYEKCTQADSDNGKSWCAYDIQPGTEVPQDGKHWGDCNHDCPGAEFECEKGQLFNIRGKCVSEREQLIRIARPYAHTFRSGLNDTKPIKKCSEEPAYVHKRIKEEKCYCLPPRKGSEKQEGEGCTKKQAEGDAFIFDAENLPGVDGPPPPPPPSDYDEPSFKPKRGWCFLSGVKDPRYFKPEEHCYDDLQWSETEQKFWSTDACDHVPPEGVPE